MSKFTLIDLRRQRALICAALAVLTVFMQGCGSGSAEDISKAASSSQVQSESSENDEINVNAEITVEDKTDVKSDEKSDDEKTEDEEDPRFDKVIVNEGVEAAVEANSPESAYVDGYYNFTYSDFGEVYSNEELKKCFDRVNEIIANSGCTMSFSYKNIETELMCRIIIIQDL